MNADKQRAVGLLGGGVISLALTTVAAATHLEDLRVAPVRLLAFLLLGPGFGAVLCGLGWARLRQAKRACPEQSWPRFLRDELIGAVVVLVLLVVCAVWKDSLLLFVHDLEGTLHDLEPVLHLPH
jgi:hypothetical protein